MPATAHLTYFKGRGHGERIRYALAAANVEYTESFLTAPGDMDALRPRLLFSQCPLLEVDGLQLVQSWATVRYLATKNGLSPATPALAFRADAAAEQVRDFTAAGEFVGYGWAPGFFDSAEARAPSRAKMASACARYLPTFEALLMAGGGIVGEAPCWADFQLLYILNYAAEVLGEEVLAPFAGLAALRARLNADARMVAHFARHAQPLVTPEYIAQVRAAQLPMGAAQPT